MNGVEVLDDYLLDLLAEVAPSIINTDPATPPVGAASAATVDRPVTDTSVGAEAPPTTAHDLDRIAAELLAEMDADPAFAAKPSAPPAPAPTLDIDALTAELLAEMDADPAFAAAKPAALAAPAVKPKPSTPMAPILRRTPPPRSSRLPANIQAMFQPAPSDPSPHRRAAERSTRWLRLRCGEQTYALELLKVQEVVLPVPLLPLRGTGRSILGIMNLRGQVVPVLDLGVHLGAGPANQDAQTRVVVLEENGDTMGLRVSSVEDVTSLTEQQIEPPDTTRLCRISNHLFRGVARISSQPVILLDASHLLH